MYKGKSVEPKGSTYGAKKPSGKNVESKNSKQQMGKKKDVVGVKATSKNADMVTLTQAEFDTIMETLGKLAIESEKHSSKAASQPVKTHNSSNDTEGNRVPHKAKDSENRSSGSLWHEDKDRQSQDFKDSTPGLPKSYLSLSERKQLEWQKQNGFVETFWRNQDEVQRTRSDPQPMQSLLENQKQARSENQADDAPRFLTATEKKKLQWERERAELSALSKDHPWGRPGGGAPIKDRLGNVVNDYSRRLELLNQPVAEPVSKFRGIEPSHFPPSQNTHLQKSQSYPTHIDAVADGMATSRTTKVSPPSTNHLMSEKEKQKQEWLQELEMQREEQRRRKLMEKKERREESPDRYVWEDRSTAVHHISEPRPFIPGGSGLETAAQPLGSTNRHNAATSNGFDFTDEALNSQSNGGNNTFIRGQNVAIDPVTLMEQQEKRRKYLELQEFNRKQIEEREFKRRKEKEQRIQEELEEERKFNQSLQTKQVEKQTTVSSKPMVEATPSDKQELQHTREELLRMALEEARLEAEREKKQRLLAKLKKGNHDVSHLEAKFNFPTAARSQQGAAPMPERSPRNVPTHVEPQSVPGLGRIQNSINDLVNSSRNAFAEDPAGYGHRMDKGLQESGTQTELGRLNMPDMSRESTGVEYRPPVRSNRDLSKKVRVVSAPKEDRRRQQPRATAAASRPSRQTAGQRPIWGYRNPEHKRPIKQSERDAFHSSDARRQRRIERQNELLQMMARNSEIVPDYRTIVTNRARSRSHENRSEDLLAHSGRGPGSERNRRNRSYSRSPEPLPSLPPPPGRAILSSRVPSPAVPSVRHQPDGKRDVNKYQDPHAVGNSNTNFVPFIRSSNVLNPAHAESPVPFSRESSEIEKARRAYQGVLNPAKYGHKLDLDRNGAESLSKRKDPLLNPSLVTEHPTHRQGQILQQLSSLRQALKEKQREMNSYPEIPDPHPDKYRAGRIISPVYD